MQRPRPNSLGDALAAAGQGAGRFLADETSRLPLAELAGGAGFCECLSELRDRNVLLATGKQLATAVALIALDGVARRIVLCPPDLSPQYLPAVLKTAEVDVIVSDRELPEFGDVPVIPVAVTPVAAGRGGLPGMEKWAGRPTEWILFTSGTTGQPKMVVHSLESLSGHIPSGQAQGGGPVWCTFYDIRRYGGLQILLRALLGGGSLVLSSPDEAPAAFLERAAANGVTHFLGTPSHWRRALMTTAADRISPVYVRLSGEVADQAILDRLRAAYPLARIVHAFASTEAGVAFEVDDGLAGFPASRLNQAEAPAEIRVVDRSIRIRSARTAERYLGAAAASLRDAGGFIDTGDIVEQRGERYHFAGRKEGIVNVGGQKVHPEEVEAVINRHPGVQMSLVRSRRNPITGAVVVADVVCKPGSDARDAARPVDARRLEGEILDLCRRDLAPHKVPVTIRIVPGLQIAASGKLVRPHA